MSDSESIALAAPRHPQLGGKTLQSLERPRYKSWRKKYRKMRHQIDGALEENKRLFKEEQKLECIAKRLREELDGLLELCLDLNQTPALPPALRFDVSFPAHHNSAPSALANLDSGPEAANNFVKTYQTAVWDGRMPPIDLHVMREQVSERLAAEEVETLDDLANGVSHPLPNPDDATAVAVEEGEDGVIDAVGWMSAEQEDAYLARLDAKMEPDQYSLASSARKDKERDAHVKEEKHWAELTPREVERQVELLNPQSQHSWLKTHTKATTTPAGGIDDDADSIASHDINVGGSNGAAKGSSKRRTGKDKNLAKQVGDRAVERAREGWSPSAGSPALDDDELGMDEGLGGNRKRGRDPDGTFRLKGGKSGSSGSKGKRKRSGEDFGSAGGGMVVKKAKVEGE